jgi:hypothetical protein
MIWEPPSTSGKGMTENKPSRLRTVHLDFFEIIRVWIILLETIG